MSRRTLPPARRRRLVLVQALSAGAAALLAATLLPFAPAGAAGESLNVVVKQVTGTGLYDGSATDDFDDDDLPGHDSSPTNDIIRTNDTLAYTVSVRAEGGDSTDAAIQFTLAQGEELVSLPPFCGSGSSVTPATLPAPVVPVTDTSWQALPQQSVVCRIGGVTSSTTDFVFLAKVRPEVPNGTELSFSASASSQEVTTPSPSETLTHTVSAAARFDLSKRTTAGTDTSGPIIAFYSACSFDPSRGCRQIIYPLTVNGPAQGKGISPLASPITLNDDLSPNSFYGPGTTTSAAWTNAGGGTAALDKYGARLRSCEDANANLRDGTPYARITGGQTATNSVRDSGTFTCTGIGVPGAVSAMTITNADTTGYTVPSTAQSGAALPANSNFVISLAIGVEIPVDAINDLGLDSGGGKALTFTNRFTDFAANDIKGQPNLGEDPANNVRTLTVTLTSDGDFSKQFTGVSGAAGNTPNATFQPGAGYWQGLPGSGTVRDGSTVVIAGQTVISSLLGTQDVPAGTGNQFARTRVMCDTWDSTKLAMPVAYNQPATSPALTFLSYLGSGGSPAWIGGWAISNAQQPDLTNLPNVQFQYGYTATPGAGEASACTAGAWYDSPAAVPGATQVDGLWTGINRVRVSYSSYGNAAGGNFLVNANIALRVLATAGPIGTVLPNWASTVLATGQMSLSAALAAGAQTTSGYDPATASGALGDRLILGEVTARIAKYVRNPGNGQFIDSSAPQYTAGQQVDYRLNPSLTADALADGLSAVVTVEDCLPTYHAYVSSVRASGAPITPAVAQVGSPAGAGLVCAADETYLRYELGPQPINAVIDPIIVTADIVVTAPNGTYTNRTLVSSPSDPSPARLRSDSAAVQLVVPTGIKIAKTVNKSVIEVNPAGVTNPRTLTWTVTFANLNAPENVSNADVIDVLPADGVFGPTSPAL